MLNSRFGYSMKKNSFKGLNIDCIQYSNIIRITYYSYSYSGTILNPNIIRICIRPNICARILFVFVIAHSEKTNIIRISIRSKFWFQILFVFVFGPKNSIRSPLIVIYIQVLFASEQFPRLNALILRFVFEKIVFHHRFVFVLTCWLPSWVRIPDLTLLAPLRPIWAYLKTPYVIRVWFGLGSQIFFWNKLV